MTTYTKHESVVKMVSVQFILGPSRFSLIYDRLYIVKAHAYKMRVGHESFSNDLMMTET